MVWQSLLPTKRGSGSLIAPFLLILRRAYLLRGEA